MIQNLTVGNPLKLIVKFALPLLLGNLVMQIFQLSDMIIVGRLIGVEALAAVGSTAPLYLVVLMVTFGFTGGLTIITAQRFGAKDEDGIRQSSYHCHLAALVLSVTVAIILGVFLTPFMRIMNVPEQIFADAYKFMLVLTFSMPLIVFYNLLSSLIRALGDSKTPLYFLIFSSVINILLNFMFIAGLHLGVVGSAFGTLVSNFIVVILCYCYIWHKFPVLWYNQKAWHYDSDVMKMHLKMAFPMALQFSILSFSIAIVQGVCNSYGADVIAAFATATRIEQFATQPLIAVGLAMATFSAQNWGANLLRRIRTGVRYGMLIIFILSAVGFVLVRYYGQYAISVFLDGENEKIVSIGKQYLLISTPFYLFLGTIFVFRNTIQGIGKPVVPLISSVLELCSRAFAAIILSEQFGYVGIFYAGPVAWFAAGTFVACGYFYYLRKWVKTPLRWKLGEVSQKLRENGPMD